MNPYRLHKESLHDLMIACLTGNLPEESRRQFFDRLNESENDLKEFCEFQQIWNALDAADRSSLFDASAAIRLFKERIRIAGQKNSGRKRTLKRFFYVASVAAFIAFLCLIYFFRPYFTSPSAGQQALSFSEINVPNGSRVQVALPDGTKVWINSGSSLQYNSGFGESRREVRLSGEACMEVSYRKDCPFIVSLGDLEVRVTGTKFNINAYKENREVTVGLSK
ncbi:MAG: FecR family protein [Tannerellaceae bacterium]|jgi:ferric-dicitrate binding protein FerR (iron transport regulator)|nr:FecR family protein [Tannerellaceae bacterium]